METTQQFLSMGTFLSMTQMGKETIAKVIWLYQTQLKANAVLKKVAMKVVSHLEAIK